MNPQMHVQFSYKQTNVVLVTQQ